LRHELIGLDVRVDNSSDPTQIGVSGKIIDETYNMLIVKQNDKIKMVPKSISVFTLILPDGEEVEVDGARLIGKPEERVRRKWAGR
jgi:ribonuclease P protein subunit POP4